MALNIEIDALSSVTQTVDYWRIGELTVMPKGVVTVQMYGYWSAADRDAGMQPAQVQAVSIPIGSTAVTGDSPSAQSLAAMPALAVVDVNAILTAAYQAVTKNPNYAGAKPA